VKRKKRKEPRMAKRILVADDSPTIRKIVELCLNDHGIEVVSAASGADAVEKMKSSAHDLILADAVMPGPDGYELCERVKAGEFGDVVPVVILADVFEPVDPGRVSACGADGQITKPFDARTLQLMVSDQMGIDPPPAAARHASEPVVSPSFERAARRAMGDAGRDSMAVLPSGAGTSARGLTEAEIDVVARRVVSMISADVVREVAWEVVPEMSEVLLKERMQGR
jgi:CheY-like chemotaxis protein